jgi:hypothetical protein
LEAALAAGVRTLAERAEAVVQARPEPQLSLVSFEDEHVKRYSSEKRRADDGQWRHTRIVLSPLNPEYAPLVIPPEDAEDFRIVAEFVAVMRGIR